MKCEFEIVGLSGIDGVPKELKINGKSKYVRLLIRKVKEEDIKEPNDVALLMQYKKKFLIIGNMNAITYKEVFPLIKENKMWLGTQYVKEFTSNTNEVKKFGNILWFTNLDHKKRNEEVDLYKKYNAEEYPKYDNYDAIEVSKTSDIPIDYDGTMGVPITFLFKYCPTQFEIIGCAHADIVPEGWRGMTKEFVDLYYAQGNTGQYQEGKRLACFLTNDGMAKVPYARILIKRVF